MDRISSKQRLRGVQGDQGFHPFPYLLREVGIAGAAPDPLYVAKVVSLNGLDAQGRAAARQEVSVLRGLASHPNLIEYRDSFLQESAGVLMIVMSFAESGDLRGVVANAQVARRALPESVVLWWLRQMLAGLAHLHAQGVVHRDLKSSNIFLCDRRRLIRIGDFGISRVLESTAFASSCVGTPAYMSPELMRNERYDYHVDMWALGCVCFELCALHLPFVAKSLFDLVHQVTETEPDWGLWGSNFSGDLQSFSRRLLRKDVAGRPTAAQMLGEPLFIECGPASQMPSEEVWDLVPSDDSAQEPVPKHEATKFSQASTTTAGDPLSENSGSLEPSMGGSGSWSQTPRMPWETSSSTPGSLLDVSAGASTRDANSSRGSDTNPMYTSLASELNSKRGLGINCEDLLLESISDKEALPGATIEPRAPTTSVM